MPQELQSFFADLDLDKLRINRPAKFIFLCGGQSDAANPQPLSLRDYIYRVRPIQERLKTNIVLAEKAIQLYRDTSYSDLISFEEDIATISSVVLVIAESRGSLAELGAFSSNPTIQKSLRIIVQQKYERIESFIRYGPIERTIKTGGRPFVGFFPWRSSSTGRFLKSTVRGHYAPIKKFIAAHLNAIPTSELFRLFPERQPFYIIYWIIYLGLAIPTPDLYAYVQLLIPNIEKSEIRNKLYCMELAGWIGRTSYSNNDYFFVCHKRDPFDYAFRSTAGDRDSSRRKFSVIQLLVGKQKIPPHVREFARAARRESV